MSQEPTNQTSPRADCGSVPLTKLAHDLRNSLYVMNMGLEVLARVRDDPDKFSQTWQAVQRERKLAAELVDRLVKAAQTPTD